MYETCCGRERPGAEQTSSWLLLRLRLLALPAPPPGSRAPALGSRILRCRSLANSEDDFRRSKVVRGWARKSESLAFEFLLCCPSAALSFWANQLTALIPFYRGRVLSVLLRCAAWIGEGRCVCVYVYTWWQLWGLAAHARCCFPVSVSWRRNGSQER